MNMFTRGLTFIAIAFILVVPATVFLSVSLFVSDVFALKPAKGFLRSDDCIREFSGGGEIESETCCWFEYNPKTGKDDRKRCQSCDDPNRSGDTSQYDCGGVSGRLLPAGDLPQLETVPPIRTLPGGDLPTLEQVPPPGLQPGSDIPTLEQGTEGEPPLPVICSEEAGLEKDPETGQCVPIEQPPVTDEQPEEPAEEEPEEEQQQPEEEQPSEESDSGDESNN